MHVALTSLACTLLLMASPAAALPPAERTGDSEEAKPDTAEKICKYVTEGMGSRRKKRLCLTEQEWIDFNRGQ